MKNECYAKRLGINAIIISYYYKKNRSKIFDFFKQQPVVKMF